MCGLSTVIPYGIWSHNTVSILSRSPRTIHHQAPESVPVPSTFPVPRWLAVASPSFPSIGVLSWVSEQPLWTLIQWKFLQWFFLRVIRSVFKPRSALDPSGELLPLSPFFQASRVVPLPLSLGAWVGWFPSPAPRSLPGCLALDGGRCPPGSPSCPEEFCPPGFLFFPGGLCPPHYTCSSNRTKADILLFFILMIYIYYLA